MVEVEKATVDRISLTKENRKKVDHWLKILNENLKGMVRITRTDLVNSLLEMRSLELNEFEIKAVAKNSFDEVRWLNSAMERLKASKKSGEPLTMDQLFIERNELVGDVPKAPRGRPKVQRNDSAKSPEIQSGKGEESL